MSTALWWALLVVAVAVATVCWRHWRVVVGLCTALYRTTIVKPLMMPRPADAALFSAQHARASDVVVACPPKSGTTWTQHICHQLRVRGAEPDFDEQSFIMPWIDVPVARAFKSFAELERTHPQPGAVRVFKTHMLYRELQAANLAAGRVRLVYAFRALPDVFMSAHPFLLGNMHVRPDDVPLSIFAAMLMFIMPVDDMLHTLCDFWEHRHDEHVLLLFFDDMRADHAGTVRRLAAHMRLPAEWTRGAAYDQLVERVVSQSTHAAMSSEANWRRFSDWRMTDAFGDRCGLPPERRIATAGKVRKGGGKSGSGKRTLPAWILASLERRWQRIVTKRTGFASLDAMRAAHRAELAAAAAAAQ